MKKSKEKTCCFIGHRKIKETDELKNKLYKTIEHLITDKNIDTFLFGSKSEFNDLCYKTVTELKRKYPHIERVYVRAEFPYINEEYKKYLLEKYEDTYYPDGMIAAGKAIYVERNREMIDKSELCVVYYDGNYSLEEKSGTKISYDYAAKNGVQIINVNIN